MERSGKKVEGGQVVSRPRQFDLALQTLYLQDENLRSVSTEDLTEIGEEPSEDITQSTAQKQQILSPEHNPYFLDVLYETPNDHVGFRGRGRPFIPQEVLDQPLRRPGAPSSVASSPSDPEFADFEEFFSAAVDDFRIYRKMEEYIFEEGRSLTDLNGMMLYLSDRAMDFPNNAPTICKYLYVFSQDPAVREKLQTAFFGILENQFMGREDILKRKGPDRYRNFIKWIMAVAHHFRNPLYAPFDELMLALNTLSEEISSFNDPEDFSLFVMLNLRFYYYASLPCSNGSSVPAVLGEQYSTAIKTARDTARRRLAENNHSPRHSNWLLLLLEVTRSSPQIDDDIAEYYSRVLPGFENLLPISLLIRLPPNHGREQYLKHIMQFIDADGLQLDRFRASVKTDEEPNDWVFEEYSDWLEDSDDDQFSFRRG